LLRETGESSALTSPGALIYILSCTEDSYRDKFAFDEVDDPILRLPPEVITPFAFEGSSQWSPHSVWISLNCGKMHK
jgi:hypothetical protein